METTLTSSKKESSPAAGDSLFDVTIISAFGRGNWLASHLSEQDWRVALIDVTGALGAWQPADWDGPFGLFESDALLPSQKRQWLSEGDPTPGGFTFWLPNGPLEGHGELAGFLSSQQDVSVETRAYLQLLGDVEEGELRRERSMLSRRRFQDAWLANLAHQVAANVYDDNDQALLSGRAIPFYAPYFQRAALPALLEDGLRACEQRGVKVYRKKSIASLRFDGSWPMRQWSSLTMADGLEVAAHAAVWTLSSLETDALNATLVPELFPKGKLGSSWCWLRFEMSVAQSRVSDSMPGSFTVVGDLFLPWTHANLAHVCKHAVDASAGRQGLDLWARVPTAFRFDRAYLEKTQSELLTLMQAKMPASDVMAERLPLDVELGADALPAPRWPVYEIGARVQTVSLKNIVVDGPEQWRGLDPLAQFQAQKKILLALEHQKRLRDERTARTELREQKREARKEARAERRQLRDQTRDQRNQRDQRDQQENDRDLALHAARNGNGLDT